MGKPDFRKGQVGKYGQNWKNCHFFQGNQGQWFQFCPRRIEASLLHIPDPNYPSFYLKCPRQCQKTYNLDIFKHFSKFAPLPLLNFGVDLKFDHIPPICILLKLDYANFGVSNLFYAKVIEKPLGRLAQSPSHLVKEGLR